MREVISNTSRLQYLHQVRLIDLLPEFYQSIIVPPAVAEEVSEGLKRGVDLPDVSALNWLRIRSPRNAPSTAMLAELGPGESQAIMLAAETPNSLIILDDQAARREADKLGLTLTGTLGILIKARHRGEIDSIRHVLDELHRVRFRLTSKTRETVLRIAGEF
jgi:hypothetical protein